MGGSRQPIDAHSTLHTTCMGQRRWQGTAAVVHLNVRFSGSGSVGEVGPSGSTACDTAVRRRQGWGVWAPMPQPLPSTPSTTCPLPTASSHPPPAGFQSAKRRRSGSTPGAAPAPPLPSHMGPGHTRRREGQQHRARRRGAAGMPPSWAAAGVEGRREGAGTVAWVHGRERQVGEGQCPSPSTSLDPQETAWPSTHFLVYCRSLQPTSVTCRVQGAGGEIGRAHV